MSTIDQRIVSMVFDNAKFEAGIAQTMASLTKLDASIKKIDGAQGLQEIEKAANKVTLEQPVKALDKLKARFSRTGADAADGLNEIEKAGNKVTLEQPVKALDKVNSSAANVGAQAADGFNEIEKASGRVSLQGLNSALDSVTAKFSVLQGAATVAMGNITSQAVMKGGAFAKSFAMGPLKQGFEEYGTNMSSIQTILANTDGQQVSGLENVNKALGELNEYSDQTIYNFSQMAKNIGTFTAAGVGLEESTASIKGIANLAALSGSNSQQASTAMYQLSQAIAAGRVGLQDWNSVVNAGMGGAVFQKSLMRTAENMGALKDGAVEIDKATGKATVNGESFRNSIMAKPGEESWLTSEVLTKTLEQMTGDMDAATLKAQGFDDAQVKAIMRQADNAKKAATEVKTLGGVFDVVRESIGSGWAKTFQTIFGDFKEAKTLFTNVTSFITGWTNKVSDARNKMLGEWKKLGGRDDLLAGLKAGFEAIMGVLKPIKEAFRDIFPATTGRQLAAFTENFRQLMVDLKPSEQTVEGLRRTFRGLFAVMHIGWEVVKGVFGVFGDLLGVLGKGSGGFLNFTGSIGDFLVAIDDALTKGGALKGFFQTLSDILQAPMKLITGISGALAGLFDGPSSDKAKQLGEGIEEVRMVISPFEQAVIRLQDAWRNFVVILDQAKELVSPWLDKIKDTVSSLGTAMAESLQNADFSQVLKILQTTFLGGIFIAIKKAISGGGAGLGGGVLQSLNESFQALTGHLTAMQQNVKASMILKIAAAIGILAAGVYVLSTIDPKKLTMAMTAVAVGMGQLVGALALLSKVMSGAGKTGLVALPVIAGAMMGLATAVLILSAAMKIFETMSWEGLAKGLAGVGGSLAVIGMGLKFIGPSALIQAPALLILAVAFNVLALAIKQLSALSWEDLGKGIGGIAVALVAIGIAMAAMPPTLFIMGPGLVAVAFALNLLAASIGVFASMNLLKMYQGILGVAGALAAIGVSVSLIPPTVAAQAAGLVILAVALTGIASAIGIFGSLGIGTLVKGLAALAASLIILSVGLYAMNATLAGSAALLVAAGALAVLAPTMAFLGTLKWSTIFKGLAAVALVLGTLAIAGALAGPGLIALGLSLIPLAKVFFITSASILMFAKALDLLGQSGTKGVAVMVAALTSFVALIPTLVIDFIKGLLEIVDTVVKMAPKIVTGLGKVLDIVIAFIIESAPKLAVAIGALIDMLVTVIWDNTAKLVAAGAHLLLTFLGGIDQNITQVVTRVGSIITKFLDGLTQQAPKIIAAGAKTLAAYLNGIANNFHRVIAAAANAVTKFLEGVTKELPRVVRAGGDLIVSFLTSLGSQLPRIVKAGGNLIVKFIDAVGDQLPRVVKAGVRLIAKFIQGIGEAAVDLADAAFDTVTTFLNELAEVIRERGPELRKAGWNLADAIVDGLVAGFKELGDKAIDAIGDIVMALPKKAWQLLKIKSPSRVFHDIGKNVMLGLNNGIVANAAQVHNSMGAALRGLIQATGSGKDFGRFLSKEFAAGLKGDKESIRNSFGALRAKLKEEQNQLREEVKQDREKLKTLMESEKPNQAKINKAYASLVQNETLLKASGDAIGKLTKGLRDERAELIRLTESFDKTTKDLELAETVLADLTQKRNDYIAQYGKLPDFNVGLDEALAEAEMTVDERREKRLKAQEEAEKRRKIDQVANYKKALQEQIAATDQYMKTLEQLRALGLDDATYKKLLEQGTSGQEFASQLLAGGKGSIDELNALNAELAKESAELADAALKNLYNAGVQAAQGIVDGLKAKQVAITETMDSIAESLVRSIKKKLGIKSPSRVLAEVGRFTVEGMAKGISDSSRVVANAAAGVADDAASALSDTLTHISDALNTEVDTDLTITPVLDLSNIERDGKKIADLANVTPITAAASYGQASALAQGVSATQQEMADAAQALQFNFEQNNYSPEALSDVEIYRQTRNQLSQVKGALGLAG